MKVGARVWNGAAADVPGDIGGEIGPGRSARGPVRAGDFPRPEGFRPREP